ncbi:MAG TPA: hypothetical protein VKD26_13805 [Streptosporangiaceae bacterium]|nr:hypothetical protein [Streptosporangiaceae bacterium]
MARTPAKAPDRQDRQVGPRRQRRADRPPRTRGWRRTLRLLRLGLVLVVAGAVVNLLTPPWVFHIGNRFTPATMWDGYGTVHASNGGAYVLYTHLQGGLNVSRYGPGGCDDVSGCSNVRGSAKMCTERGAVYSFALAGVVSTWWSTDGAPTSITLQPNPPRSMPGGFVFVFSGSWRGTALPVASDDNSFTEVFAPGGAIRWTTPTRDAGGAAVTLRAGTSADFARACGALPRA